MCSLSIRCDSHISRTEVCCVSPARLLSLQQNTKRGSTHSIDCVLSIWTLTSLPLCGGPHGIWHVFLMWEAVWCYSWHLNPSLSHPHPHLSPIFLLSLSFSLLLSLCLYLSLSVFLSVVLPPSLTNTIQCSQQTAVEEVTSPCPQRSVFPCAGPAPRSRTRGARGPASCWPPVTTPALPMGGYERQVLRCHPIICPTDTCALGENHPTCFIRSPYDILLQLHYCKVLPWCYHEMYHNMLLLYTWTNPSDSCILLLTAFTNSIEHSLHIPFFPDTKLCSLAITGIRCSNINYSFSVCVISR